MSRCRARDQSGSGLIGTTAGLLVFLLLLIAAVQVLFDLYATSMVTTAAHDAARTVAGFDSVTDRCAATHRAEADLMKALGAYGRESDIRLDWTCTDPDWVRVRVTAAHPGVLPAAMVGMSGLGRVDRTIVVRAESPR